MQALWDMARLLVADIEAHSRKPLGDEFDRPLDLPEQPGTSKGSRNGRKPAKPTEAGF